MKGKTMRVIAFWMITLAFLAFVTVGSPGCRKAQDEKKKDGQQVKDGKKDDGKKGKEDDDHPDEGPHGGALAEWGNHEYHAEFTVNHKEKMATVYILEGKIVGGKMKAAPIDAESITLTIDNVKPKKLVLTLKADPEASDPKGKSSRFSGVHKQLEEEKEFEGEISGKVGKTPYAGKFKEEKHEHEKK